MTTPLFNSCGGYRRLDAYAMASIVQLATLAFCRRFLNRRNDPCGRQFDQMTQAARSGVKNLVEGSERLKFRTVHMMDSLLAKHGDRFREEGGFHERMTAVRTEAKREQGEAVDADAPACPQCGQPMRLRNGRNGNFWGCTAYPTCRGTLEVTK
jgi:four helix bundle suffix protein